MAGRASQEGSGYFLISPPVSIPRFFLRDSHPSSLSLLYNQPKYPPHRLFFPTDIKISFFSGFFHHKGPFILSYKSFFSNEMGTIYNLPKFEPRRKSLSMSRHKPYCQCHWMSVCPLGRNDALSSPSSSEKSSDTSSEKSDSEKFSDRSGNDAVITVTEIILADEVEQKDSKEDGTSFATEAILAEELEQKDSKEDVTSTTKDSPKNAKQTQKNLKAPIYKLPTEILSEIISFLPASSLVTATRVAKFMNTAIHSYVESENAILAPGIMLPTHGVDKWRYVCDEGNHYPHTVVLFEPLLTHPSVP